MSAKRGKVHPKCDGLHIYQIYGPPLLTFLMARRLEGMTVRQAAAKWKVSASSISRARNGKPISYTVFSKLMDGMKIEAAKRAQYMGMGAVR